MLNVNVNVIKYAVWPHCAIGSNTDNVNAHTPNNLMATSTDSPS
jgi:hypothetical protein